MNIIKVKEQQGGFLVNDEVFIPKDSSNTDYQEIQKWIANGGISEHEDVLTKAKLEKISQIKSIRDQKNIEPITDYQGFIIDSEGSVTTQESYFVFYTNRHLINPASDPESIILRVMDLGSMPYFTKNLNDQKITVQLTPEIATALRQRITERNNNNYKISSALEIEINNAQSVEEIEAISNQILNQ